MLSVLQKSMREPPMAGLVTDGQVWSLWRVPHKMDSNLLHWEQDHCATEPSSNYVPLFVVFLTPCFRSSSFYYVRYPSHLMSSLTTIFMQMILNASSPFIHAHHSCHSRIPSWLAWSIIYVWVGSHSSLSLHSLNELGKQWLCHDDSTINIIRALLKSPYGIGQTTIFLSCRLFFFFSSPNLRRHRLDVCHTSTPGVALVRI